MIDTNLNKIELTCDKCERYENKYNSYNNKYSGYCSYLHCGMENTACANDCKGYTEINSEQPRRVKCEKCKNLMKYRYYSHCKVLDKSMKTHKIYKFRPCEFFISK